MFWFFLAIAAFVLGHILPGLLRRHIVSVIGNTAYVIVFSVISTGLLIWVVAAELNADYIALWPYDPRAHWVPVIAMIPVCMLWVAAVRQPCPLSIGRSRGFDPQNPGINRLTRHPLLLGFAIWGTAHLFPNGHLAALIFFGGSAVFAIAGFWRMETMRRSRMDAEQYRLILERTRRFDITGLWHGAFGWRDVIGGLILYGVILYLHPIILGRDPLAFPPFN